MWTPCVPTTQGSRHEVRHFGIGPRAGAEYLGGCVTHAQFLRIKKLTGKGIIEVAARHNHREILAELGAAPGERIDPTRVGLNRVLRGFDTASAVASQAKKMMDDAGVKPLKRTAVMALEIIFGLPPQSTIDHDQFFCEAVQWAEKYFAVPNISAIVHNDEAAPHCHVLLLPLVDGRMVGSDLMGGRAKLLAMHADFHTQVGQLHGLTRQATQKRHSAATRQQAIDLAFEVLEANSGLSAAVLRALLVPHMNDPAPLLLEMGLTMPAEKVKPQDTFVGIMTRSCKPELKPIGIGKRNPIGIDDSGTPEKELSLSCVGKRISTPPFPPPNEPQQATQDQPAPAFAITASASIHRKEIEPSRVTSTGTSQAAATNPQPIDTEGDYVRVRDNEQPTKQWSDELGEFILLPVKQSAKRAATSLVRLALASQNSLVCSGTL